MKTGLLGFEGEVMDAPINVVIEMSDGTRVVGHLDFGGDCNDADLPHHQRSISRPVIVPDMEANPDQPPEQYCLGCWIDDDQSKLVLIGDTIGILGQ